MPDDKLYRYPEICAVGFDLWQVKAGTIFDNVLITDDEKEADAMQNEILERVKEEKKMREKQEEEEKKTAQAAEEDKKDEEIDREEDDSEDKEEKHDHDHEEL